MAKILVADDSKTELAFLLDILKGTGHEIVTAVDGLQAEERARAERFDLIFLDVIMPNKNGFQVCRALKRDPSLKQIPIILTTSKSGESDKFWGKKQGADEYIVKPYEPVDILLAVKKYLGGI
ncbi:response regulator [Desulfuromonas thiophila]|uniref:Response regulator receiver protein n=1 Tax=Desulfuromonas thiophila TaxID=57664 RepID=A0A1G7AGE5_9BACT|nr:response regulator [Desulfuromonas thiophila]MCK9172285.1 response regulator [Desulfuromonas thiophila]MDD3801374.1 response regulator [Desulfuromonas thiophila]MDY0398112.1 response regulator [Desulfuromonas thiophila]SDE14004.1 response regulator receiver protein [Desulfuromonas thiophila]